MSSTPLNKIKDKQKPMESHEKQEYHRLLEEELLENQKTNPGCLEEEHFQGKAHECGMLASSLQSKEPSQDKKSSAYHQ